MGRSSRLLSADRGRVRASRQLNPPSPASHPVEWHLPPPMSTRTEPCGAPSDFGFTQNDGRRRWTHICLGGA